jgi:hypothetical protein
LAKTSAEKLSHIISSRRCLKEVPWNFETLKQTWATRPRVGQLTLARAELSYSNFLSAASKLLTDRFRPRNNHQVTKLSQKV